MLDIILSATDEFPVVKLRLEHSLLTISKWESEHGKPFFGPQEKNEEETLSYIRMMVLNDDPPANFTSRLEMEHFKKIAEYLNSSQTATTFGPSVDEKKGPSEIYTSELIYYWLTQFQIPFYPTETWHINRLMVLVKIAGIKQSKPKKMNKNQIAEQYRALNEKRRLESGSAG